MDNDEPMLSLDRTGPDFLLEELESTYLSSGDFSDLLLVSSGGRRFPAHRAVLAPLSRYLKAVLRAHSAVASACETSPEGRTVVVMPDVADEEMEALLTLVRTSEKRRKIDCFKICFPLFLLHVQAYCGEVQGSGSNHFKSLSETLQMLRVTKDVWVDGGEGEAAAAAGDRDESHGVDDSGRLIVKDVLVKGDVWKPQQQRPHLFQQQQQQQRLNQQRQNQLRLQRQQQLLKQQQQQKQSSLNTRLNLPPSIVATRNPKSSAVLPPPPAVQTRKRPLNGVHSPVLRLHQGHQQQQQQQQDLSNRLLPEVAKRLTQQHPQISIQPSRNFLDRRTIEMFGLPHCKCPNCADPSSAARGPNGERIHVCHYPECAKEFRKATHLREHLRTHLGRKVTIIRRITLLFRSKLTFFKILLQQQPKMQPQLPQTPLPQKPLLQQLPKKPLPPPLPQQQLPQQPVPPQHLQQQLQQQQQLHPYTCSWKGCDRRFARPDELQRHFRSHTGERRHRCTRCDKAFGRPEHLAKHMATHSGVGQGAMEGGADFAIHGEGEEQQDDIYVGGLLDLPPPQVELTVNGEGENGEDNQEGEEMEEEEDDDDEEEPVSVMPTF